MITNIKNPKENIKHICLVFHTKNDFKQTILFLFDAVYFNPKI